MAGKAIPKHTSGMCTANDMACICRAWSRYSCSTGPPRAPSSISAQGTLARGGPALGRHHRRIRPGDPGARQGDPLPDPDLVRVLVRLHPRERAHDPGAGVVVVTTTLLVIALLGLQFWIDVYDAVLVLLGLDRGSEWIAIPVQVAGVALAVVCFRRGRKLLGVFGLFVPLVALIGAVAPTRAPARSSA